MKFLKKNSKGNEFIAQKYYGALKKAEAFAEEVLSKVDELGKLESIDFKTKTEEFKRRLNDGETLNDVRVEAFAYAHKAIQKVYGISLYKVQLMGGFGLDEGDVSEMKTGEGKTLTAIAPAYLNSLEGKGVHVITVNEYLSKRDAFNTSKVLNLLGVSVGTVLSDQDKLTKKKEYSKDVTYITNSELGFDFLKDNLVKEKGEKVQRGFNYAIVDEVDSILIDEARTPLIISGGGAHDEKEYIDANEFVISLKEEDYELDEESKQVFLTTTGVVKAQKFFNIENLYSFENSVIVHRIQNALSANNIFNLDVDYTVKNDEIVLIDVFTGRLLEGRQFSEGLNQALEAKEGVKIKPETKTFASITYQNLFRSYKKLSGMSGTALPEEEEFLNVYNMRVLTIPTNIGINRTDHPDVIFGNVDFKFEAVIEKIKEINAKEQPILVGTRSVFDSEKIAKMLEEQGIKHEILNAKNHSREAEIISKAGEKSAVTISTNMAGRGTDIKLGEGVRELGGLFVLGTERHESRRIDDQLRGRSGRQGDVGESVFYVSLDDEIMKRAGVDRVKKMVKSLDREPIQSKMVGKSITAAQKRMEGQSYDSRKGVMEYDDVLNNHRIATYKQRDQVLAMSDPTETISRIIDRFVVLLSKQKVVYDNGIFSKTKFLTMLNTIVADLSERPLDTKEETKDEIIKDIQQKLSLRL